MFLFIFVCLCFITLCYIAFYYVLFAFYSFKDTTSISGRSYNSTSDGVSSPSDDPMLSFSYTNSLKTEPIGNFA